MKIKYVKGNLFDFILNNKFDKKIIIPHVVNDIGAWGAGFVVPLAEYFPEAKERYLNDKNVLGNVQYVSCLTSQINRNSDNEIWVANMVAQSGIMSRSTGDRKFVNNKPIRYAALVKCLQNINLHCRGCDIISPAFGSDLAGGNWPMIAELIEEILTYVNSITVFYLNDNQKEKMKKGLTIDI